MKPKAFKNEAEKPALEYGKMHLRSLKSKVSHKGFVPSARSIGRQA